MQKKLLVVVLIIGITLGLVSACTTSSFSTEQPDTSSSSTTQTEETEKTKTGVPQNDKLVIYAPASTSSIPVIIAASKLDNVDLQLYTNQSQANTLFLRGEVNILVTGLSVGADIYSNGAPAQLISSYVSGLSYLVTYGKQITSLSELKGQSIYVPFEGSPIEQVIQFLTEKQGLTWKTDITPVYSPFDSSIELLKQGTANAVVLPEPSVTVVEGQPDIYISLSLYDEWNAQTGNTEGYPQVAAFVRPDWAEQNPELINSFNQALSEAVEYVQENPEAAISEVQSFYKLPAEKLTKALSRTRYNFIAGEEMKIAVENYYQTIGKPIDETFTDFYFIPAQ